MHNPRISLCTRADDAGCCLAANRAVVESARFGIVKNISVMVPGPAFDDAAKSLCEIKGISIGLHVTLNAEWAHTKWGPVLPADQVPALVDVSGYFTQNPGILHERQAPVEQMIAEVQAQLDKARRLGLHIEYVDEHMGVGWLPGFRDAIAAFAEREGIRYPLTVPGLPHAPVSSADPLTGLAARLTAAEPGVYVLVNHPMCDDADAHALLDGVADKEKILRERDGDRRFWQHPHLADVLRANGTVPTKYIDLPAALRSVEPGSS